MTNQDRYRLAAGVYDRLIEPMQAGVRRVAFDLVPPQPDWEVLDVGCGTGTGMALYAEAGCDVVGVDTSAAMLARAESLLGNRADLHLTDGDALPFEDDRFDLTMTSMVLHEVTIEARPTFVAEMARVTRPEGKILIIDFHFGDLRRWKGPILRAVSEVIERFAGHFTEYQSFKASGGVPSVLEGTGLTVVSHKPVAGGNVAIYVSSPD